MRVSRVTQKARINNTVEPLFAETPPVAGGHENAARQVSPNRIIAAAVVLMNQRYAGPEHGESATLLSADEPEVGIT